MRRVLMLCSSTDGQTRRICERLSGQLRQAGDTVELVMVDDAGQVAPTGHDLVVVGARIRYGHHDPRIVDWVTRHAGALNTMPSAFFSVNIVARKAEKNRADTNPYVRKFLRRVPWRPTWVDVFAGKLNYPAYGPLDRRIIRFIMWMTRGPTQPDAVVEFTDWQRVEDFGRALGAPSLTPSGAAPPGPRRAPPRSARPSAPQNPASS